MYLASFLTGLSVGGISCLMVIGGILASSISKVDPEKRRFVLFSFFLARIVSHFLFGFVLGTFGNLLNPSLELQSYISIIAGIYIILVSLSIIFKSSFTQKLIPVVPISVLRFVRKLSGFKNLGPILLGFFSFLIPCGVTQGIMLLSIASGSGINGALILSIFIIGTTPALIVFSLLGGNLLKNKYFSYISFLVLFYIGVSSINAGQILRGSNHTLQNYYSILVGQKNSETVFAKEENGVQKVEIQISNQGYRASANSLRLNVPTILSLSGDAFGSCAQNFVIPELDIKEFVNTGETKEIKFTPTKKGKLVFSCSMGMYPQSFNVI